MLNRTTFILLGALALCTAPGAGHAATLRLATPAPKSGPWGRIFRTWAEVMGKRTGGAVDLAWQWGAAGSEKATIEKIRAGELAGAAVTGVGLATLHAPAAVLRVPGVLDSWSALDAAREVLRPELDRALGAAGLARVGWADFGAARMFSKGFPIVGPEDLRLHTTFELEHDLVGAELDEVTGVNVHTGLLEQVRPLLTNRLLDVVTGPPLIANELGWTPYLDHVNDLIVQYDNGAILMGRKALDSLSPDAWRVLLDTGAEASAVLVQATRRADDAAYAKLRRRLIVALPGAAQRRAWERSWKRACERVVEAIPGKELRKIGHC